MAEEENSWSEGLGDTGGIGGVWGGGTGTKGLNSGGGGGGFSGIFEAREDHNEAGEEVFTPTTSHVVAVAAGGGGGGSVPGGDGMINCGRSGNVDGFNLHDSWKVTSCSACAGWRAYPFTAENSCDIRKDDGSLMYANAGVPDYF